MGNKIKRKYFCIGGKHQNFNVNLNRIIPYSAVALVGIFGLMLFPVSFVMDSTEAAPVQSTTTLTLATSDLSAEITPSSAEGTFSASDPITIGVRTNNYTGYTLGITSSDNVNNTKLINTNDNTAYLTSISSASSAEEFNVNNWGYLPSKLNSQANTNYQPAPTTTATTLDATNTANTEANTYTIALGAKADYSLPSGTYENSFTLTAVANPVAYTITYNKNTEDEVENMPENQSGSIEDTDITIPNTTPTRAHYTFQGWCNVTPTTDNGIDSCSGTTYQPGDVVSMNKTTANNTTLYALWKIDTFTQTTEVRYEVANADGTYGSYTTVDTKTVNYGDTYSWSTSQIQDFDSATYNETGVTIYTVTEAKTNQVDITRKSYTLTIDRNTSYISSVTGAGTYKVGKVVPISATASSGNKFTSWSQTAGTTSSFGSTSSASTTFTMPASAATIYANGTVDKIYIQNVTTATCPTSRTLVYDSRDEKPYYIQKIGSLCWMTSNLNIAGGTKLTSAKSNVASDYTLPASSTAGFNDNTKAFVYNDSTYGGYYSWVAATAGTNPSSGDSTYDICPKGWHLPSKANYDTLKSTYTTGATLTTAPWYGAYGGLYGLGSAYDVGSYGDYWSSTAASNSGLAFLLYFDSSSADTNYSTKNYGLSVRCIAR